MSSYLSGLSSCQKPPGGGGAPLTRGTAALAEIPKHLVAGCDLEMHPVKYLHLTKGPRGC